MNSRTSNRCCRWRFFSHFSLLTSHFAKVLLFAALTLAPVRAEDTSVPLAHPRLLINPEDVAAIRMRCGIRPTGPAPAVRASFGVQRDVLERLKDTAHEIMKGEARHGDLFAPALLHLVTGEPGRADAYTRYVTDSLLDPRRRLFEIDALVALDWCWESIEEPSRTRIIERLPVVPEAFSPAVSPLNHLDFNKKLCGLAAAILRYRSGDQTQAETTQLYRVIKAGREYLQGPFVEFYRQRGAVPTSGEQGIWEETDYCLALELLRSGLGINLWPELANSFGRSMEHYFYADTEHPGLEHGFIHDDGTEIPHAPGRIFRGFAPAVPWAIAAQTGDPVAIWYANRSLPRQGQIVPEVDRYGWVRLVYGPLNEPEADRSACPLGRHFGGGWVAMRTGWAPGETVVLFDAGQPFWRSRQHFDAGHFQIYRKGRLTVQSGDDVTFQAIPSQQGRTILIERTGALPKSADWDHYFQSTIAHNCVTVADPKFRQHLYGRPWTALGNQRLIGHNYDFTAGDVRKAGRETGRLTAFETHRLYSFAAADLTAAYPPETVRSIRREILLLNAGAVLVLDRVHAATGKSIKTWHLQLPAPPQVLGGTADLSASAASVPAEEPASSGSVPVAPVSIGAKQIHGTEPDAGLWQLGEDQDWLAVTHLGGRLFVRTLWPAGATRRLIGGPMRPRIIPGGPSAGRTYFGGDPAGFEYRLWPAAFLDAPSAAYELGRPMGLGPQFGVGAAWGRLDVSPSEKMEEVVFLHLLIPTDATVETPPAFSFSEIEQTGKLDLTLGAQQISVSLSLAADGESSIQIRDESGQVMVNRRLTREIEPDEQLPRLRLRLP